ncbi:MAG TPA: protein kinase, partial [Terracidiphilus sp.]|nr:protein kinase [Terracidiphilus sp.]
MTPARWQQIVDVLERVRQLAPDERAEFLNSTCTDDSLRSQVESLLDPGDGIPSDFLRTQGWARLAKGARSGDYEIVSMLGAGGMGEVYRARDLRLARDVAIKVLPPSVALDSERLARFEREAKALAALNHANIAHVYGFEGRALIMELVPGKPLKGPLSMETALDYARQIAAALEAAHEKGIVHRDLKPANIMVTPDGVVKVLDFGLAAVPHSAAGDATDQDERSTLTRAGMIMGTASYMSPEQARGRPVDKRTDIWAFGVVLYEMLTGKRLFQGETATDVVSAVLTQEIDWNSVPWRVRRLLRRCLERDAKKRLRDIADWETLLEAPQEIVSQSRYRFWIAIATLAAATILFGVLFWRASRPTPHPLMRFNADLGPDAIDDSGDGSKAVLSPNGMRIAFVVRGGNRDRALATRMLGEAEAVVVPGTEGASGPVFSPDGQSLAFNADGKLKKVPIQGGPVTTLCDAPAVRGIWWGADGYIYAGLTLGGGISRVSEAGGTPEQLTDPAATGEVTHRWPQLLPGGKAVLFTGHTITHNYEEANIEVLSLKTGKWKIILRNGYHGRYVPTGHLLYVSHSTLYAAPFDLSRLEVRGAPVPLLDDVAGNIGNANGQFDAEAGVLLYVSNRDQPRSIPLRWIDAMGNQENIPLEPGLYGEPHLSPDGSQLALVLAHGRLGDIAVYDLRRQSLTRLTFTQNNSNPVWAPDSRHIAYVRDSADGISIQWIRADGAGGTKTLFRDKNEKDPWSMSPDGHLAFAWLTKVSYQLWTLPLDLQDPDNPRAGAPQPFVTRPSRQPEFSPDGRWIAFTDLAGGVRVRPFPPPENGDSPEWQISNSGSDPAWSRAAPELFYLTVDGRLMAVPYTASGGSFAAGKPRLWLGKAFPELAAFCCDRAAAVIAPDGKRFVMPVLGEQNQGPPDAQILLNF